MKKQVILDTSIFVNPAAAQAFGSSPTAALVHFLEMARELPDAEFLMPPMVYAELMHFAEEAKVPKNLLLLLHKKAPKKHETKIPGIFLYELVDQVRDRVDRGLRLAERHVREALEMEPPPRSSQGKRESFPDADIIKRLRESYRRILREGMLDSRADVDLLLLAYETGGILVSADLGVVEWAQNLGITCLPHDHLMDFLLSEKTRVS